VNHSDEKDGAFIVAKSERLGARNFRIDKSLDAPLRLLYSCDEQSDAARGQCMIVCTVRPATKESDEDVDCKDNESSPHQTFADSIEAVGKSEMQKDGGGSKDRNRNGMAECIEQAKSHAFAPGSLHARDIGNGSEVIVVEAVA